MVNNQKLINSTAAENALRIHSISILEKRLEQLKRISVAYPAANRLGGYQVVSFEKGSERYIFLPSQMAAVKTEILSINESITQTARRLLQSSAEGKILAAQSKVVETSTSGRELVTALISDTKARLANAEEDYDKLILLTYFNDYSELKSKYLELSRFISAPDYSNQPIINPFKVTFGFSVLGLSLALIYQFRNKILALVRAIFWSKSPHFFKTQA